MHRNKSLS